MFYMFWQMKRKSRFGCWNQESIQYSGLLISLRSNRRSSAIGAVMSSVVFTVYESPRHRHSRTQEKRALKLPGELKVCHGELTGLISCGAQITRAHFWELDRREASGGAFTPTSLPRACYHEEDEFTFAVKGASLSGQDNYVRGMTVSFRSVLFEELKIGPHHNCHDGVKNPCL